MLALQLGVGSASAAQTPIEDRGAPAPGAHYILSLGLPGWEQVYFSESAVQRDEEEAEGSTEQEKTPATGDYSKVVRLDSRARCFMELESNAIFSPGRPEVSDGVVSGTGTHLLRASRRDLHFATSGGGGENGADRWYLGSLQGNQILGLAVRAAPPALVHVGDRYLIFELALRRRAYLQPRDVYLSPTPSSRERQRCLRLEQRAISTRLRPILSGTRAIPGRYRAGARVPGHALPRCVEERCPAVLVTPSVEIYRAVPYSDRLGETAETFARWRANGRVTNVGVHGASVSMLEAVGEFVAYPQESGSKYPDNPSSLTIVELNAATGRKSYTPASGSFFAGGPQRSPSVSDLVLAADGALAWIVEGTPENPRVNVLSRTGAGSSAPETLASGESLAPTSLVSEGALIRWREGAVNRDAPFG